MEGVWSREAARPLACAWLWRSTAGCHAPAPDTAAAGEVGLHPAASRAAFQVCLPHSLEVWLQLVWSNSSSLSARLGRQAGAPAEVMTVPLLWHPGFSRCCAPRGLGRLAWLSLPPAVPQVRVRLPWATPAVFMPLGCAVVEVPLEENCVAGPLVVSPGWVVLDIPAVVHIQEIRKCVQVHLLFWDNTWEQSPTLLVSHPELQSDVGLPSELCRFFSQYLELISNSRFLFVSTGYSWEEKMFGFHKPKMYRSIEGCCICRAKSSSSRFTDSKRYEKDFQNCFG